jgi:SPP1 family predicted phage head-tail adaptor
MKICSSMNKFIDIEKQQITNDGGGGQIVSWKQFVHLPAAVTPMWDLRSHKGERVNNMQLITYEYYRFSVRYRDDITTKMRVVYQDNYYDIHRVINLDEKNQVLVIIAEKQEST